MSDRYNISQYPNFVKNLRQLCTTEISDEKKPLKSTAAKDGSLETVLTWYTWILNRPPNTTMAPPTAAHVDFLYGAGAVEVTAAILKRKTTPSASDEEMSLSWFSQALSFVAASAASSVPDTERLLQLIARADAPFWRNVDSPRTLAVVDGWVDPLATTASSAPMVGVDGIDDSHFSHKLSLGDLVDCYVPELKLWMEGTVTTRTEFGEFEVTMAALKDVMPPDDLNKKLPEDVAMVDDAPGQKKSLEKVWLSPDNPMHRSRVEPYGTKTGTTATNGPNAKLAASSTDSSTVTMPGDAAAVFTPPMSPPSATKDVAAHTAAATAAAAAAAAVELLPPDASQSEIAWRVALKVGDLLDARNNAGIWVQAIVVAIEAVNESMGDTAMPAAPHSELRGSFKLLFVGSPSTVDAITIARASRRLKPLNYVSGGARGPVAVPPFAFETESERVPHAFDPTDDSPGVLLRVPPRGSRFHVRSGPKLLAILDSFLKTKSTESSRSPPVWMIFLDRLRARPPHRPDVAPPTWAWVAEWTAVWGNVADCWTRAARSDFILPWLRGIVAWLRDGLTDEDVRAITRESFEGLIVGIMRLERISQAPHAIENEAPAVTAVRVGEGVLLCVIGCLIASDAVMQRREGLRALNELIASVRAAERHGPSGVAVDIRGTFSRVPVVRWLTGAQICAFLKGADPLVLARLAERPPASDAPPRSLDFVADTCVKRHFSELVRHADAALVLLSVTPNPSAPPFTFLDADSIARVWSALALSAEDDVKNAVAMVCEAAPSLRAADALALLRTAIAAGGTRFPALTARMYGAFATAHASAVADGGTAAELTREALAALVSATFGLDISGSASTSPPAFASAAQAALVTALRHSALRGQREALLRVVARNLTRGVFATRSLELLKGLLDAFPTGSAHAAPSALATAAAPAGDGDPPGTSPNVPRLDLSMFNTRAASSVPAATTAASGSAEKKRKTISYNDIIRLINNNGASSSAAAPSVSQNFVAPLPSCPTPSVPVVIATGDLLPAVLASLDAREGIVSALIAYATALSRAASREMSSNSVPTWAATVGANADASGNDVDMSDGAAACAPDNAVSVADEIVEEIQVTVCDADWEPRAIWEFARAALPSTSDGSSVGNVVGGDADAGADALSSALQAVGSTLAHTPPSTELFLPALRATLTFLGWALASSSLELTVTQATFLWDELVGRAVAVKARALALAWFSAGANALVVSGNGASGGASGGGNAALGTLFPLSTAQALFKDRLSTPAFFAADSLDAHAFVTWRSFFLLVNARAGALRIPAGLPLASVGAPPASRDSPAVLAIADFALPQPPSAQSLTPSQAAAAAAASLVFSPRANAASPVPAPPELIGEASLWSAALGASRGDVSADAIYLISAVCGARARRTLVDRSLEKVRAAATAPLAARRALELLSIACNDAEESRAANLEHLHALVAAAAARERVGAPSHPALEAAVARARALIDATSSVGGSLNALVDADADAHVVLSLSVAGALPWLPTPPGLATDASVGAGKDDSFVSATTTSPASTTSLPTATAASPTAAFIKGGPPLRLRVSSSAPISDTRTALHLAAVCAIGLVAPTASDVHAHALALPSPTALSLGPVFPVNFPKLANRGFSGVALAFTPLSAKIRDGTVLRLTRSTPPPVSVDVDTGDAHSPTTSAMSGTAVDGAPAVDTVTSVTIASSRLIPFTGDALQSTLDGVCDAAEELPHFRLSSASASTLLLDLIDAADARAATGDAQAAADATCAWALLARAANDDSGDYLPPSTAGSATGGTTGVGVVDWAAALPPHSPSRALRTALAWRACITGARPKLTPTNVSSLTYTPITPALSLAEALCVSPTPRPLAALRVLDAQIREKWDAFARAAAAADGGCEGVTASTSAPPTFDKPTARAKTLRALFFAGGDGSRAVADALSRSIDALNTCGGGPVTRALTATLIEILLRATVGVAASRSCVGGALCGPLAAAHWLWATGDEQQAAGAPGGDARRVVVTQDWSVAEPAEVSASDFAALRAAVPPSAVARLLGRALSSPHVISMLHLRARTRALLGFGAALCETPSDVDTDTAFRVILRAPRDARPAFTALTLPAAAVATAVAVSRGVGGGAWLRALAVPLVLDTSSSTPPPRPLLAATLIELAVRSEAVAGASLPQAHFELLVAAASFVLNSPVRETALSAAIATAAMTASLQRGVSAVPPPAAAYWDRVMSAAGATAGTAAALAISTGAATDEDTELAAAMQASLADMGTTSTTATKAASAAASSALPALMIVADAISPPADGPLETMPIHGPMLPTGNGATSSVTSSNAATRTGDTLQQSPFSDLAAFASSALLAAATTPKPDMTASMPFTWASLGLEQTPEQAAFAAAELYSLAGAAGARVQTVSVADVAGNGAGVASGSPFPPSLPVVVDAGPPSPEHTARERLALNKITTVPQPFRPCAPVSVNGAGVPLLAEALTGGARGVDESLVAALRIITAVLDATTTPLLRATACAARLPELATHLFNDCLFGQRVKCLSPHARRSAFDAARALVRHAPVAAVALAAAAGDWIDSLLSKPFGLHAGRPLLDMNDDTKWEGVTIEDLRGQSGYAGLRNLGCICYMNAVLQQFFCIDAVREAILGARPACELVPAGKERMEARADSGFYQLQALFGELSTTTARFADPTKWCATVRDMLGEKVSVCVQDDAEQFLGRLIDTVQDGFKGDAHGSAAVATALLSSQRTVRVCTGGCNTTRSSVVPLSRVQVKKLGAGSLPAGLEAGIEWEEVSGVQCDACNRKTTTRCAEVIDAVADCVFFQLCRFSMNWETGTTAKSNARFEFPENIDLFPYSFDALAAREDLRGPDGVPLASSGGGAQRDRAYWRFRLAGIVMHSGSLESGHYYSFIRERGAGGAARAAARDIASALGGGGASMPPPTVAVPWHEFNDSNVTAWDSSALESTCFGSPGAARSAYILLYEREPAKLPPFTITPLAIADASSNSNTPTASEAVKRARTGPEPPAPAERTTTATVHSTEVAAERVAPAARQLPIAIRRRVFEENARTRAWARVSDGETALLFLALADTLARCPSLLGASPPAGVPRLDAPEDDGGTPALSARELLRGIFPYCVTVLPRLRFSATLVPPFAYALATIVGARQDAALLVLSDYEASEKFSESPAARRDADSDTDDGRDDALTPEGRDDAASAPGSEGVSASGNHGGGASSGAPLPHSPQTAAASFTPAPLTGLFSGENVWGPLANAPMSWLQSSVGYGLSSPTLSSATRYSLARFVSTAAVRVITGCSRRDSHKKKVFDSATINFLRRITSPRVVALLKQRFQDSHFSIVYDTLRMGFGCGMPLAFTAAMGDDIDGDVARDVVLWGAGNTANVDTHPRSLAGAMSYLSSTIRDFVNREAESLITLLDLFRGYESRVPAKSTPFALQCKRLFGVQKKPEESTPHVDSQPKWTRLLDTVALLAMSMAPPHSNDAVYPIPPLPVTLIFQISPVSPLRHSPLFPPPQDGAEVTDAAEMHAYWAETDRLLNANAKVRAQALIDKAALPAVDEALVSLLYPRVRGWAPATPVDPRLAARDGATRRPPGLVQFLSQTFPPPPPLAAVVMADTLRCTLHQASARVAVLFDLGSSELSNSHGGEAVSHIAHICDPNPIFQSAHAAVEHLGKHNVTSPMPALLAYLSEVSLDNQTSVFGSILINVLNCRGALVDGTWSDPCLGPNPEAIAQLLTHVSAYSADELSRISVHFKFALKKMLEAENLMGLAGCLAVVEPLYLCSDFFAKDFRHLEDSRPARGAPMHVALAANLFRVEVLSHVVESVLDAIHLEQLAEATNTTAISAAVKLVGALSRLVVLNPALAFIEQLLGARLTEQENPDNRGLFLRLRIQSLLQRVIDTDESVDKGKDKKTPAWMWEAIGRAAGTSPVPTRADAEASMAVGAPGILNAVDAQCVKVRAYLLRVLAGPVTELSATAEGIALALAKPTRPVHAAIILARFERAFRAVGRPLVPRDQLEALLLATFPLHHDVDTSNSINVSHIEEEVVEDDEHFERDGENVD